jgi:hypothetical protein
MDGKTGGTQHMTHSETVTDVWGAPASVPDVPANETLAQRRRREATEAKNKPKPKPQPQPHFCVKHQTAFNPDDGCLFCQNPQWKQKGKVE